LPVSSATTAATTTVAAVTTTVGPNQLPGHVALPLSSSHSHLYAKGVLVVRIVAWLRPVRDVRTAYIEGKCQQRTQKLAIVSDSESAGAPVLLSGAHPCTIAVRVLLQSYK
jgi:hypothetical protein